MVKNREFCTGPTCQNVTDRQSIKSFYYAPDISRNTSATHFFPLPFAENQVILLLHLYCKIKTISSQPILKRDGANPVLSANFFFFG